MDNRKPPPSPPATAPSKDKGDDDDELGRESGCVNSLAAKRKQESVSPPQLPQEDTAKRRKNEQGKLENDTKKEEQNYEKKKHAEEDILHGNKATDDDNSTVCRDQDVGVPESTTKPAAIEVLSTFSDDIPTERMAIGSITDPAGVLHQGTKLDVLQCEKDALTARVQELEKELDRKEEQLVRKDEILAQKETALRQAGKVIGAPITVRVDEWAGMPRVLRNEPGAMAEYIAQQTYFSACEREGYPEDVLQKALPQLLERHRAAALKAVEGEFLSWEEVNPTPEEYNESEELFIRAIQSGIVRKLSDIPFQESIPVYMEAVEHGIVTDISQISHLITASVPLTVAALKQGLVTHSSQASVVSSDLVLDAQRMQLFPWACVPDDLKNDLNFCRALLCPQERLLLKHPILGKKNLTKGPDESWPQLVRQVFELHRHTLFHDFQVWKIIIDFSSKSSYGSPADELFEMASCRPVETDILRYACTKCPPLLSLIDQVMHQGLVRELVIEDRSKLFLLQEPFLEQLPDFFIEQLGALERPDLDRLNDDDIRDLLYLLPENIWTDHPDLINTWIEVGLPLLVYGYSDWEIDREKLLRVVEHGAKQCWRVCSLQGMPHELRSDTEFISRAMEFEPAILGYASPSLREDKDLQLWALSDTFYLEKMKLSDLGIWWPSKGSCPRKYTLPEKFVEEMNVLAANLRMQQMFMKVFLVAVESESHQSGLGLLRNPVYLRSIRDYAGIPSGNTLRHSRLALINIKSALESRGVAIPTTWSC